MSMFRLPARWLGRHPQPPASAPRAPGAMRQRVLAIVRGDAARLQQRQRSPERHHGRSGRRLGFVLSLLIAAASGGTAVLVIESQGSGEPTAKNTAVRAQLRRIGSRAELIVSGMSEPPPGEVYELWLERRGKPPQPTDALFAVTSTGDGTVEVPGGLRGVISVMVTREPRGGSSTPTGTAVLRVAVRQRS